MKRRIEVGYIAPGDDGERSAAPAEVADHIVYYIEDNGIGIDANHHDQVFRLPHRLHGRAEWAGGMGERGAASLLVSQVCCCIG